MAAVQDQDDSQESFFTGLSNKKGTKPGFAMKNETFLVEFEGIQIEKLNSESQARFVKNKFESCYDWAQIMELILECFEYFYDEGDFQIDCQSSIKAWLSEFEGWGLMFTLLPPDFQKYLLFLYAVMVNKNMERNLVKSNFDMFYDLTDLYERETQGLPLSDLVPKVEARLLNIIGDSQQYGDPKMCERRKMLKIKFLSQRYTLVANFAVEKLRINRTLAEHAAEVLARMVDDVEELGGEIPETLKPVVTDKINDADWVASHWWAKYKFNKENLEDHNQKTVPQVGPDPHVSMTKSFLHNLIGTFHDFAFANLTSSSPERLFICLASTAAAAVLHYQ